MANSSQFKLEKHYATLTMPPPLYFELLTGLQILRSQFNERRQHLECILAEKKQISPEDAEWLDGAANLTDETVLLEKLSEASEDYEKTFEGLSLREDSCRATAEIQASCQQSCRSNRGKAERCVTCHFERRKMLIVSIRLH